MSFFDEKSNKNKFNYSCLTFNALNNNKEPSLMLSSRNKKTATLLI